MSLRAMPGGQPAENGGRPQFRGRLRPMKAEPGPAPYTNLDPINSIPGSAALMPLGLRFRRSAIMSDEGAFDTSLGNAPGTV